MVVDVFRMPLYSQKHPKVSNIRGNQFDRRTCVKVVVLSAGKLGSVIAGHLRSALGMFHSYDRKSTEEKVRQLLGISLGISM